MVKIWRSAVALGVGSMLLGLTGALGGCGGAPTACDHALDKVEQCGVQDVSLNEAGEACEGATVCQAECFLKATCGDVKEAAEFEDGPVVDCVDACR